MNGPRASLKTQEYVLAHLDQTLELSEFNPELWRTVPAWSCGGSDAAGAGFLATGMVYPQAERTLPERS